MNSMNILVTLDRHYLGPLRVMIGSLFFHNPGEIFDIYMIGDDLTQEEWDALSQNCKSHNSHLHPLTVPESLFEHAPVYRYYSRAMYYRLLAADLLPDTLDRILYLDPDILVIGKVRELYETAFAGELFAAAMHNGLTGITGYVSKLRLPNYETDQYFNSGVLVMNLKQMRKDVRSENIFAFVEKYKPLLVLPDQDVLNGLYGDRILRIDESRWNYDVRHYEKYRLLSLQNIRRNQQSADHADPAEKNMDWVMAHTSILHFCGKNKPWHPQYRGRFSALYKHYKYLIEENRI
jgi:lipopolysaccharide biosynthesis glycosyltransferase